MFSLSENVMFAWEPADLVMSWHPPRLPKWTIPELTKKGGGLGGGGGLRTYFSEKNAGMFRFFILPLEIQDQTKLYPRNSTTMCYTRRKF